MALAWANAWHFGTWPLVSPRLKWRLRNDYRNSILMTDVGSAYDWLKKISLTVRPIRITTQIWVVTHFCSRFSDVILRGGKPVVASRNAGCFLRLTWPCVHPCISSDSCRIKILIARRYPYSLQIKLPLVMHGINLNPLFIVDSWEISCSSSTLPSKLLFARLSLTCVRHPHNLRA